MANGALTCDDGSVSFSLSYNNTSFCLAHVKSQVAFEH